MKSTCKIENTKEKKVAIIHYWLVNMRGGEKVVESLCRLYPQADIYCLVADKSQLSPALLKHNIYTSFLQKMPGSIKHYNKYIALMPFALEQFDLTKYDLVISSESGPAKGVLTRADTAHLCYCHSPMRYLWDFYHDYLKEANPLIRFFMRPVFHYLRMWDRLSAGRVDLIMTNSKTVARRVKRWWEREAQVVYPYVPEFEKTPRNCSDDSAYLCLGQLVGYKRVDLAVRACTMTNRKLIVAGIGTELEKLQKIAGPTISFAGWVSDKEASRLYATSKALLFPGEEDFGFTPVEAQYAGCPVVAYAKGGALETVIDGKTGLFFEEQTAESLIECLDRFEKLEFDQDIMEQHVKQFSEKLFHENISKQVEKVFEQLAIK